MRGSKRFIGGRYHYADGTKGLKVLRIRKDQDIQEAADGLPPVMLSIYEVWSESAAEARKEIEKLAGPEINHCPSCGTRVEKDDICGRCYTVVGF